MDHRVDRLASRADRAVRVLPWPHLPVPAALNEPMEEVHEALAWIAIGLFVLHVAGALRHQFLLRDPVIGRIAPAGSVAAAMALLVATIAVYFGVGSYVAQNTSCRRWRNSVRCERASGSSRSGPDARRRAQREATPRPSRPHPPRVSAGPPPEWTIAGGRRLAFSVGNGGSRVAGRFNGLERRGRRWTPTIPRAPTSASASSLPAQRWAMPPGTRCCRGADFLASSSNRTATWRSTKSPETGPGRYHASGTLTIRGRSRPQAIAFTLIGKDRERHVAGSATSVATAFGIGTGEAGESLGTTVALEFSFDATAKAR